MTYAECNGERLVSNMPHCLQWAEAKAKETGKPASVFVARPKEQPQCVAVVTPC